MPLSKRINNLHINTSVNHFMKINHTTNSQMSSNSNMKLESPTIYSYNPELNASQNPFYYQNNKVLFELYVERMQRNGASQF